MVHTKLERSFDSEELHRVLSSTLHQSHNSSAAHALRKIERPPLPPGSQAFEQAKGELEIERQSNLNGSATLPNSASQTGAGHSSSPSHLAVPASSPVLANHGQGSSHGTGSNRGGRRSVSGRRSPNPQAKSQRDHGKETLSPRNASSTSPSRNVPSTSPNRKKSSLLDVPGGSPRRTSNSRDRSTSPKPPSGNNSPRA